MKTEGLCSRFTVVRTVDEEPIDGAVYRAKSKANKRAAHCHDSEKFAVREVVVMPAALAKQLIDFYVSNQPKE